jgi:hypothetical protein
MKGTGKNEQQLRKQSSYSFCMGKTRSEPMDMKEPSSMDLWTRQTPAFQTEKEYASRQPYLVDLLG